MEYTVTFLIFSTNEAVSFRRMLELDFVPQRSMFFHLREDDKSMTTLVIDRVHYIEYHKSFVCCCGVELPGASISDGARVILPYGTLNSEFTEAMNRRRLWQRIEGEDERFFTQPRELL